MNFHLILKFYILFFHLTVYSIAQVGIGTNNPKVTLQVTGDSTNPNAIDGIKLPKMTLSQLYDKSFPSSIYGLDQVRTTIYITDLTYSPNQNPNVFKYLKTIGPCTFNGTYWIPSAIPLYPISIFASKDPQVLQNVSFGKEYNILLYLIIYIII